MNRPQQRSRLVERGRARDTGSPPQPRRLADACPRNTRRGPAICTTVLLAGLALSGCDSTEAPTATATPEISGSAETVAPVRAFADITAAVGLDGSPMVWPDGTFALPEITGGGVALFDADGDGDLDILQARVPPPGEPRAAAPNRLFRQGADGRFEDATDASGLGDPGYSNGFAIGDVDGDGHPDVYVTNFGRDAFYRNRGDGTYVEDTLGAGFSGEHWSTSAAFHDYDGDGDLDLYVVNYVIFDAARQCASKATALDYCGPQNFPPAMDILYRNDGSGHFTDVTAAAGITRAGPGLGVLGADLNGDGRIDFYVANDGEPNQMWINQGDGSFVEEAIMRGSGYNAYGKAEASMGVVAGDVNGDGRLDLFMTHLRNETNTLYLSTGDGMFEDASDRSGIGRVDLPYTGFGCTLFDYDHDGDLDIAVVNGRVKRGPPLPGAPPGFWRDYAEPNLLLANDGGGGFTSVGSTAGAMTEQVEVSRGLAVGDIDRDGDLDLVIGNIAGDPRVLRNDAVAANTHWLRVRALHGARDAIGAAVTLIAAERRWLSLIQPGQSYASSSEPIAHFGLGAVDTVDAIEVRWTDGQRERFAGGGADRLVTVVKGTGS